MTTIRGNTRHPDRCQTACRQAPRPPRRTTRSGVSSNCRQGSALIVAEHTTIVRAKIDEFCAAGGVDEAQITKVSNPDQILTEREQVKFGYKDGGGA